MENNYSTLQPHALAVEKYELSVEYARLSELQATYIKKRAEHFNANRGNFKSDKATERAFEASEDGVAMEVNKVKLRTKEKRISAINSLLRLAENEAKNNF